MERNQEYPHPIVTDRQYLDRVERRDTRDIPLQRMHSVHTNTALSRVPERSNSNASNKSRRTMERKGSRDSQFTAVDPLGHQTYSPTGKLGPLSPVHHNLPREFLQGKGGPGYGTDPAGLAMPTFVPNSRPSRSQAKMVKILPEISLERAFFYTLWFLLQAAIFIPVCVYYMISSDYTTSRKQVGQLLGMAQASAMCINFNSGFILLLVCRNTLSYLRSTFISRYVAIDKNIHAHKVVAWTIAFMVVLHVVGHGVGYISLVAAMHGAKTFTYFFFQSNTGLTGNLMLAIFIVMFGTAVAKVRRKNFELFYYTHHLFIAYYIIMFIHGSFCVIKADREPKCQGRPDFWKFVIVPALIYTGERVMGGIRGRRPVEIIRVVQHPSEVVQVQFRKADLKIKTGQYVFINCPEISKLQWHPFTLTSAPEDDYISVHIRMAGGWTRQFAERLGCNTGKPGGLETKRFNPIRHKTIRRIGSSRGKRTTPEKFEISRPSLNLAYATPKPTLQGLPQIRVDGPFGAPTEHVFDYEVSVLVGAGIGVTPFASVLKSLWHRVTQPGKLSKLRKVYFIWVCRDIQAFEWFQDLLMALEEEDLDDFLDIRAYLTGELSEDQIRNVTIHDSQGGPDALTGRKNPTYFGRPNFDQLFAQIAYEQPRKKMGVFICGRKPLVASLRKICQQYSTTDGTTFDFHKETF
ncbi:hypothetical protein IWQ62_000211 [Dispira parvispora]|uniref:FAD-binding FR-type domain-containing protein n=1 Tax=Dispira parvispora TaxID=1520584 RepID=A0A9W8AUX6_9FUNG|nr:hypothetical protein IWQ62_000211 [Dispira parvispora]